MNWAMPLTVGNGNQILSKVVKYGFQKELTTHELLAAVFARLFLLGCSMNCVGYVGGFIFPMITISIMAGAIAWQNYPYLPYGLCIGCFLAALPGGIVPMPLTLASLSIFMFYFGMYQTGPIFIATMTSYTLVSGSGLFGALQKRAKERELAQQEQEGLDVVDRYGHKGGNGITPVNKQAIDDKRREVDAKAAQLALSSYRAAQQDEERLM